MDQAFYNRILAGLKAIYSLRRSPHHGTPMKWELKPDGIYAMLIEQYGLGEQTVEFSFRTAATMSWCKMETADSIKIFGERYTLDGEKLSR